MHLRRARRGTVGMSPWPARTRFDRSGAGHRMRPRPHTRDRMRYVESVLGLVGATPLVRLSRVSRGIGPADRQPLLLAKLEMLNPGGSVKDRIGLPMIEAAERDGLLRPGGTIIEPTSGNTGHGPAIAAVLTGYRCSFVMPGQQAVEMQSLTRA